MMVISGGHIGGLGRNTHSFVYDNSDAGVGYTVDSTITLADKSADSYDLYESINGGAYTSVTLTTRAATITSDLSDIHLLKHTYTKDGKTSPPRIVRVGNLIDNGNFEGETHNIVITDWTARNGHVIAGNTSAGIAYGSVSARLSRASGTLTIPGSAYTPIAEGSSIDFDYGSWITSYLGGGSSADKYCRLLPSDIGTVLHTTSKLQSGTALLSGTYTGGTVAYLEVVGPIYTTGEGISTNTKFDGAYIVCK